MHVFSACASPNETPELHELALNFLTTFFSHPPKLYDYLLVVTDHCPCTKFICSVQVSAGSWLAWFTCKQNAKRTVLENIT